MIHIGITGTRTGFNDCQLLKFHDLMLEAIKRYPGSTFHHGDCVGVDVEAALVARTVGFKIVGHPPIKTELRGYFEDDETLEARGYFERNRDIVNASDLVIVVPWQMDHADNGGTWYTHDYAVKQSKPVAVFWPQEKE